MRCDIGRYWKRKSMSPYLVDLVESMRNKRFSLVPADQYHRDKLAIQIQEHGRIAVFDYLKLMESDRALSVERVNEEFPMVVRYNRRIFP